MSSALGEPPDSGISRSADATGAATRLSAAASSAGKSARVFHSDGTGAAVYGRAPAEASSRSGSPEAGRPLLQERLDALREVPRSRHLLLDPGLQRELLVHAGERPGVELALAAGVGAGGAGGEPLGQLFDLLLERVVGRHAVHEPPLERLPGW